MLPRRRLARRPRTLRPVGLNWRIIAAVAVLGLIGLGAFYLFTKVDLESFISAVGYPGLFLIVFAETGLLIGFFLPGDTLLITTGLLCQRGQLKIADIDGIWFVIPVLIAAAVIGDFVGFQIGRRLGPRLYSRPDSRLFRRDHLEKATDFYNKHGGKTIVLARFLAFIRTFAPTVAGAAGMPYPRFAFFNIIGGVVWVVSLTLAGYFIGKAVEDLDKYFTVLIVGMVTLSVLPAGYGYLKQRRRAAHRA